jgi:hypothetical protein
VPRLWPASGVPVKRLQTAAWRLAHEVDGASEARGSSGRSVHRPSVRTRAVRSTHLRAERQSGVPGASPRLDGCPAVRAPRAPRLRVGRVARHSSEHASPEAVCIPVPVVRQKTRPRPYAPTPATWVRSQLAGSRVVDISVRTGCDRPAGALGLPDGDRLAEGTGSGPEHRERGDGRRGQAGPSSPTPAGLTATPRSGSMSHAWAPHTRRGDGRVHQFRTTARSWPSPVAVADLSHVIRLARDPLDRYRLHPARPSPPPQQSRRPAVVARRPLHTVEVTWAVNQVKITSHGAPDPARSSRKASTRNSWGSCDYPKVGTLTFCDGFQGCR